MFSRTGPTAGPLPMSTLGEKTVRWVGLLGLGLLALGVGPSSAAISLSYVLLLAYFLLTWRYWHVLWQKSWLTKALILLTLYVLIQGIALAWLRPDLVFETGDLQHLLRTVSLGTLVVGWAVYATGMSPRLICVLALIGFGLATAEAFIEHGWALLEIRRLHYLRSPNEVGLFGATIALGAFFLGGSFAATKWKQRRHGYALTAGVLAAVLMALGLWLWIQSGSRSTWVGLLTCASILAITALIMALVLKRQRLAVLVGTGIGSAILVVALVYQYDSIQPRVERELPTIGAIASGDYEALMEGRAQGHNARFKIWAVAMEDIRARPILGLGGGFVEAGFEQAEEEGRLREGRGHYHNLYLHLAVFIGAPAVLIWVIVLGTMTARTFRLGHQSPQQDVGLAWFLLAWALFFAVTSLFQVRMHSAYGAAYFVVFSGLLLGMYLSWHQSRLPRSVEEPTEDEADIAEQAP